MSRALGTSLMWEGRRCRASTGWLHTFRRYCSACDDDSGGHRGIECCCSGGCGGCCSSVCGDDSGGYCSG